MIRSEQTIFKVLIASAFLNALVLTFPSQAQTPPIAFATSELMDGSITEPGFAAGVASADAICDRLALAAGLDTSFPYKAWLSTDSSSPSTEFMQPTVRYRRADNTGNVADSWLDLIDGLLISDMNFDENGAGLPGSYVWTGTLADGTADTNNCSNWTSGNSMDLGDQGTTFQKNTLWTDDRTVACDQMARLFCFQQGPLPVDLMGFSIE